LPLFATLRRYTFAVLGAAEQAALPSGAIYTDTTADAESSQVEPMDTVEMDRGTWMTMPFGWKISQVKAEETATVYGDFKHEVINEIARCLNMPFNIAAGNSSGYNYASGASVKAAIAMMTSKGGSSPPYHYVAIQATADADGVWTQVDGGAYRRFNPGALGAVS
jgi:hypothetical protein